MSHMRANWPLLIAGVLAALGVLIFWSFLRWNAVTFNVQVTTLAGLLAPLAFAAAVVERAVEILISPWRDAGASKRERELAAIQTQPIDPAAQAKHADGLKAASDAVDEYRGKTQQYAFAVSLTLSILVSIAGVRALGPFLDVGKFNDLAKTHPAQQIFFLCIDVALSAALLAGGADGIHSIVNAITSFFNASAEKSKA